MTDLESSHDEHRAAAAHNVSYKETDLPEFACEDPDFEANMTTVIQVTTQSSDKSI